MSNVNDKKYLKLANDLAKKSKEPIKCGSIFVDESGNIVASNFNSQRKDKLTYAHAEMKSIFEANTKIGRKLKGITAYSSCEPCTMCLTALIFAGVKRIVFANRLNDLVEPKDRINIDCFEFIKSFPYQPVLEYLQV
jgi:tRNA(Arg) A34 adenosine deaminase TadA